MMAALTTKLLRLFPPGPAYMRAFKQAIRRTERIGLSVPPFEPRQGALLNEAALRDLAVATGDLVSRFGGDPRILAGQCLAMNVEFEELASEVLGIDAVFTIGAVRGTRGPMFGMPARKMTAIVRNGPASPLLNLHAWLTLPTYEIVDITLMTSMAVATGRDELTGHIVADHPANLRSDLRYRPTLVGTDFLFRTGLAIEGTIFVAA